MISIPKRYTITAMTCYGTILTRLVHHSTGIFHFLRAEYSAITEYETDVIKFHLVFCIGNLLSPLTGIAATRYGGVTTLGLAFALLGSLNVFLPLFYEVHDGWIFIAMFTQGILFSLMSCAATDVLSRWSPLEERCRLSSFIFIGASIGTLLLYSRNFIELVFDYFHHIAGGLTVILAIVWYFTVKNDPDEDENLTNNEKQILAQRLQFVDTKRAIVATYPWKQLLKSKPLWTLNLCSFIYTYCDTSTRSPKNEVSFSSMYFSEIASLLVAGYIADYLRNRGNLSSTKVHKYFICTAFVVEALLLVISFNGIPFNDVIYCSISTSINSLGTIVLYVNLIDLSPNYAGFLCGIKRVFLSLGSATNIWKLPPNLMEDNPEFGAFHLISSILLYLIGAVVYYVWGSGDVQPWNNSSSDGDELEARRNSSSLLE